MPKAVWNGAVVAESDETVMVEGNHYFPPESVNLEYFEASELKTSCPWKGSASYYDVVVDGERYSDAAWHYPDPAKAAAQIKDHVAFYGKVQIEP